MTAAPTSFGRDPAEAWESRASIPTPRGRLSAAVVDGMIYMMGGRRAVNGVWGEVATVERYDPVANAWKGREDMEDAGVTDTSSAVVDGMIYTITGNTVQVYDPEDDIWEVREDARIVEARFAFPTVAVDGLIYAISGVTLGDRPDPRTEAYDPATDEWTPLTDIPTPRMSPAGAAVDGIIYIIGGETGAFGDGPTVNVVEAYDPATDTWTEKAPMPTARMLFDVAVVDGKIYAVGGWPVIGVGAVGSTLVVEIYDPVTDTWAAGVDLPERIGDHACAAVNGVIYTSGGTGSFNFYAYDTGFGPSPQSIDPRGSATTSWGALR
jgi:N-acetylneuraminic acid mutarotase